MSSRFVLYRPPVEGGSLLLCADEEGVQIFLPTGEEFLCWAEINRIYLSQQIPRQIHLVFQTEAGEGKKLLIARLPKNLWSFPSYASFALLKDGVSANRREAIPVLLHLRDNKIISSLLSVRRP